MRKPIATAVAAVFLANMWSSPVAADVSTTQHLPAAACNADTMNAHESVPEETGSGAEVHAHEAIPGTENVIPCGHGG